MSLLQKFKGGFIHGEDYAAIEILLNQKKSTEETLYFELYDANLFALPDYHTFDPTLKQELKDKMLGIFEDYDVTVYLDKTIIKTKGVN